MPGKTRVIKRRMKAVSNIKRITDTMRMIATARFQKLQKRAVSAQDYTKKIAQVVGELSASAASGSGASHPLLAPPAKPAGRQLLLVITSNRGLCGAYNANVLRAATAFLKDQGETDLELIGKKGLAYFRFTGRSVSAHHSEFGDTPEYTQCERLADRYMTEFIDGKFDAVWVDYMAFHSASRQSPELVRLLPLEKPSEPADIDTTRPTTNWTSDYEFAPDPEELLSELLPITVKTRLYQCVNESVVSEQLARMVAMKAATDAAGKMSKELTRRFNRARQTAITTELSEIIGGAAALG